MINQYRNLFLQVCLWNTVRDKRWQHHLHRHVSMTFLMILCLFLAKRNPSRTRGDWERFRARSNRRYKLEVQEDSFFQPLTLGRGILVPTLPFLGGCSRIDSTWNIFRRVGVGVCGEYWRCQFFADEARWVVHLLFLRSSSTHNLNRTNCTMHRILW